MPTREGGHEERSGHQIANYDFQTSDLGTVTRPAEYHFEGCFTTLTYEVSADTS